MREIILLPTPRKLEFLDQPTAARESELPAQGYRLEIFDGKTRITAADEAGRFYAEQTLKQLRRQFQNLPAIRIEDWPDFPVRGVMLDISRDKVPTMATLLSLVDLFAELKINQLQLYTEHAFAYRNHLDVWRDATPMTPDEIRQLDAYCKERFIELVPNQNSFGHMERWLKHARYEPLAEKPDGFTFPWGTKHEGGFSLNPLDPRSLELVESLFDELLPNFSSRMINVGCDETFDIGLGKSKAECERVGKQRVYLEFLLKIHDAVKKRGRVMQFWGDIVLHHPELIREQPKDLIALNWGYDADHPFAKETKAFADAGVKFYVCPGTSSWLSISGRSDNAIANLKSAAENGLKNGANGYLITDWGDLGHLQYLPVSFLGFAAGAAYSWCLEANRDLDLAKALDLHVFRDASGVMGKLARDLGNVHLAIEPPMGMSTRLFWTLIGGEDRKRLFEMITKEQFEDAERRIDEAIAPLADARMQREDSELIKSEFRNAAVMLGHACRQGRFWLGDASILQSDLHVSLGEILDRHRSLWLSRNRPGGLPDSCRRLELRRAEFSG